jgi:hypothetical protein
MPASLLAPQLNAGRLAGSPLLGLPACSGAAASGRDFAVLAAQSCWVLDGHLKASKNARKLVAQAAKQLTDAQLLNLGADVVRCAERTCGGRRAVGRADGCKVRALPRNATADGQRCPCYACRGHWLLACHLEWELLQRKNSQEGGLHWAELSLRRAQRDRLEKLCGLASDALAAQVLAQLAEEGQG